MKLVILIAFTIVCHAATAGDNLRKIHLSRGVGLLPQVVDSAEWKTTIYFHNMEAASANVAILFADDRGMPLRLPFAGKFTPIETFVLQRNETRVLETDGTGSLKQGYAAYLTCDRDCGDMSAQPVMSRVAVFAVFRQKLQGRTDNEAVVPSELPVADSRLVFDNRNGYTTGVALVNYLGGSVSVTVRDATGAVLKTDTLRVAEDEKTVFVLTEAYPETAGKCGSIEFSGRGVAAMGLRFNPNGSFTSSHAMTIP